MLIEKPCLIPEPASKGIFRNDGKADFIADKRDGDGAAINGGDQLLPPAADVFFREQKVGQPKGEAIDKDRAGLLRVPDRGG